jgi:hypothetical protein
MAKVYAPLANARKLAAAVAKVRKMKESEDISDKQRLEAIKLTYFYDNGERSEYLLDKLETLFSQGETL